MPNLSTNYKHSFNNGFLRPTPPPLHLGAGSPMDKVPPTMVECFENVTRLRPQVAKMQVWSCALMAGIFGIAYGLRISEVMNMVRGDILANGSVLIKGAKGSASKVIQLSVSCWKPQLLACTDPTLRVWSTNQKVVYRTLVSLGVGVLYPGYLRKRVTHLGRHLQAEQLQMAGLGDYVGDSLGHKSAKSADWYKKEVNLKKDRERKRRQAEAKKCLNPFPWNK